mmetsp:Transcript_1752/g.1971  ORF Transcript_1752/g.1971 Transcript_1752/m.1971 type:complete len:371 (+) Transcript_1752:75-1187(+)
MGITRLRHRMIYLILILLVVCLKLILYKEGIQRLPSTINPKEESQHLRSIHNRSKVPLYSNLSCPFEWSKYSCFHQGDNVERAQASYDFAALEDYNYLVETRTQTTTPFTRLLPKNVVITGDSTMRQIFIALGCLFSSKIEEYYMDWMDEWPCHGTANCIGGGVHSGFNVGRFTLSISNTTFWFIPTYGSLAYLQPFLINGWRKELARNKPVSFRLTPEHEPVTLGDDDVIVHNLSLHITNRNKSYEDLVDFGQQLLSHSQRTQQLPGPTTLPLPRLVYVSTFTQHFQTDTGIFEENTKKGPGCVASLNSSIRRDAELTILQAGTNVHQILVVDDLDKGGMHIGKDDCTHYCMPGVPDITASRLLKLLAT